MYLYKILKLYPLNGLRNSLQVSALSETSDLHPPQLTTDMLKNAVLPKQNYGQVSPKIDKQFVLYVYIYVYTYIYKDTHIYTEKFQ